LAGWTVEFWKQDNKSPIYDWLIDQPPKVQARFLHVFELLEERGIQLGMPHVKYIKAILWTELRPYHAIRTHRVVGGVRFNQSGVKRQHGNKAFEEMLIERKSFVACD
jgi:hypothetical protein